MPPEEVALRLKESLTFWETTGTPAVLLRGLARAGHRAVAVAEVGDRRLYRDAMLLWVAQWGVVADEAAARGFVTPDEQELLVVDVLIDEGFHRLSGPPPTLPRPGVPD